MPCDDLAEIQTRRGGTEELTCAMGHLLRSCAYSLGGSVVLGLENGKLA